MAGIGRVFAMQSPFFGDAQRRADPGGGAIGGDEGPNLGIDVAALAHRTLAVAAAVGPRWPMASMMARRVRTSATASAGISICRSDMEHLMSLPTGLG